MTKKLSVTELDYLTEMMTIGAGNAATALGQLLNCPINIAVPSIHIMPAVNVPVIFGDPNCVVSCVVAGLLGDLRGNIFFLVTAQHKKNLLDLLIKTYPGADKVKIEEKQSTFIEVGNIIGGVFLSALHDFCRLHLYHTVPVLTTDMLQAIIDESIATASLTTDGIFLIKCEFIVSEKNIDTYMLLILTPESMTKLVDSLQQAIKAMGSKQA